MDYVFGTASRNGVNVETVKTVGSNHSGLTGHVSVRREYADSHITDVFDVIGRIDSRDGDDGLCYDWYEIDRHYRYEDRHTPQIGAVESALTELEILSMEQERTITDNEIAIMELKGGRDGE